MLCHQTITEAIRAMLNPHPADITAVMGDSSQLLDPSRTGVDLPSKPAPVMVLPKIDFAGQRPVRAGDQFGLGRKVEP